MGRARRYLRKGLEMYEPTGQQTNKYRNSDPAGKAESDQYRAEALDLLRTADSFLSVTYTDDKDGGKVSALMHFTSGSEDTDTNTAGVCRGAAEALIYAFLSMVPEDDVPGLVENSEILLDSFARSLGVCMEKLLRERLGARGGEADDS